MDNALYKKISDGLAPIIKSIQSGVIPARAMSNENTTGYEACQSYGEITDEIAINEVNPEKSIFICSNKKDTLYNIRCSQINANSMKIVPDQSDDVDSTYLSKGVSFYVRTKHIYDTYWTLIEFY